MIRVQIPNIDNRRSTIVAIASYDHFVLHERNQAVEMMIRIWETLYQFL